MSVLCWLLAVLPSPSWGGVGGGGSKGRPEGERSGPGPEGLRT